MLTGEVRPSESRRALMLPLNNQSAEKTPRIIMHHLSQRDEGKENISISTSTMSNFFTSDRGDKDYA